jgi:outer membrane protein assembly factor BamE (lipoprotein component of BamABCDE complex)
VLVGMTKDEVRGILGDPPHGGSEVWDEHRDYWEYGHVSSVFAPVPDNYGHVVYFDKQGRVSSTKAPEP